MPELLNEGLPDRSARSKFDFTKWADGQAWKFVKGEDYTSSTETFRYNVKRWAKTQGVEIELRPYPDVDADGNEVPLTKADAVALGVPILTPADFLVLNAAKRVNFAPIAILGAGTGLGEANLVHDGLKWNVVPSEGGHADFAPQDEEQARLFLALHAKFGHVSWERLLSGAGVVNIHNFLSGEERPYDESLPMEIAKAFAAGDEVAARTFAIFVDIYGAEAGNMALRVLARGGVYLAGGVAAKNIEQFTDGRFMTAFLRKGRFQHILAAIPVNLITNPKVGLLGAAEMAMRLL